MDLNRLPHFGSAPPGGQPPPLASNSPQTLQRLSSAQIKRPSKAGEWRLMFPHTDEHPTPSYVEEFNDIKKIFAEGMAV
jgi:hypothetical protein